MGEFVTGLVNAGRSECVINERFRRVEPVPFHHTTLPIVGAFSDAALSNAATFTGDVMRFLSFEPLDPLPVVLHNLFVYTVRV